MNRRDFLRSAGAVSAGFVCPKAGCLLAQAAGSESWRTFEVETRVEVLTPSGATRVWMPAALLGAPLGFLMYPQAETNEGRLDSLDPDTFKYEITSREIPSTTK